MDNEIEINRDAFAEVHCLQMAERLEAAGEWSPEEVAMAVAAFRVSEVMQHLVDFDVERVQAMIAGQVH
jgi:hypothetical protein